MDINKLNTTGKRIIKRRAKGGGRKGKPYRTKTFSIRHKLDVIEKVRLKFNKEVLQEKGRQWLDNLAQELEQD